MGVKPPRVWPTVPRLWPGSTIVCIGTGPSLTQADVDACCDRARVIVVNDAYRYASWADVLYACDGNWWRRQERARAFGGLKYACQDSAAKFADVQVLRNFGRDGLSTDPTGVCTGYNSGYQAMGVARHLGAARILLLGYDMSRPAKGPSHCFGEHPDKSQPPYAQCLKAFETIVAPLKAEGITVLNCSRTSALTCFPRADLATALKIPAELMAS